MSNKNIVPSGYHDYLYRLTYYLLSGIAPYIPARITPNQITLLSFLFAMTGTALLFLVHTPLAYLYWVTFNFAWFLLDALDGMHARLTNQASEYGAFLDHALDNIYFIFMLTVFAAKFDLMHLLYVYIIILRVTAATIVFIVQCHTKKLYLSRFSGGLEFLLLSSAMILSYAYPNINVMQLIHYSWREQCVEMLHLQIGFFMKLALLVYFIGIPVNFILQFRFTKQILKDCSLPSDHHQRKSSAQ